MSFFEAIKMFWLNYATFQGRTSRTTFWWTIAFLLLATAAISIVFPAQPSAVNLWGHIVTQDRYSTAQRLWSLIILLPVLALTARRLHDTNRSAHALWYLLIPFAGVIMVFIWVLERSEQSENRFGPAEKSEASS
jgi:uncharacterized membrane protein YhaH (DUF805 family)